MSERYPPEEQPTRRHPASPEPRSGPERRPPSERIPGLSPAGGGPTRRTRRPEGPPAPPPPEQPPAGHPPAPPREPHRSGLYVPWWGFLIVILGVAAITCGMWVFVLSSRGDTVSTLGPTPTPIFVMITSTPTLGPPPETRDATEAEPTPTPTEEPLPTDTPSWEDEQIEVGRRVIIQGTEGVGLAIRQGPGVDYSYFLVGRDGESFAVEDGPRIADGYTWWYLVDPGDRNRAGWAVQNYLEVVQP